MEERNLKISITHLYPKLLNLNGDMGNIQALVKRCEWRGIGVEYTEIGAQDEIKSSDLFFIGGAQDRQQADVAKLLCEHKSFLHDERDKGSVFLGICGGYQLLGKFIRPIEGDDVEGVGLLDAYTLSGKKRFSGNVTLETEFLTPNTIVGFENHSGLTYLEGNTKPLGKVIVGKGNNGEDKTEGARKICVFGTYLHGSLLPKNPHFADLLIELALKKRYGEELALSKLDDTLEVQTHNSLVGKAY